MNTLNRVTCSILIAAAASLTATPNSWAQDEQIRIDTALVSVNVSVTDSRGRQVANLDRNQFEVFADNVRQEITHFADEEATFSIGIIYDMHPSTRERRAATLGALRQFIRTLRADDNYFIIVFNERGSLALDFVPSVEQVDTHLAGSGQSGATALYDAVHLAADRIRQTRHAKKALLIISDGQDHQSRHSYREIRGRIREFDVHLYGIGVGDAVAAGEGWMFEDMTRRGGKRAFLRDTDASFGRAVLDEMARASGGAAYFPERDGEQQLVGIFTQIALELRRQYTVGFYPTGTRANADWHRLRIRVRPADEGRRLHLAYREGYQRARQ